MRVPKVFIVFRKHNDDDENRAKEMRKIFMTASQMMGKAVDIELSSNLRDFRDYQLKQEEMPVIICNNRVIFTKHVPPIEFIKQVITTPEDQQKYF